jgi:RNA polymerase sigma-70 factor, ECF subfamily
MPQNDFKELEEFREYLGLLGRLQLDAKLTGKVDISGVVQVTLMEAVQSEWSGLSDAERVPWLRRVFANNLLDEVRKFRTQARDTDREQSLQQSMEESASGLTRWLASEQSTPSQKAIKNEEEIRLVKALACLPVTQREAIELHHLQGLSLESIGKRMKRNKGAVAALIFRGTKRLRELLLNDKKEFDD